MRLIGKRDAKAQCYPRGGTPQRPTGRPRGRACTCCFMVFVSHSSNLPGTWLVPLLPISGAETSTWEARLGAAAEQTKEAPLGLHASDRILQYMWGQVSTPPVPRGRQALALRLVLRWGWGRRPSTEAVPEEHGGCGQWPPTHLGISSLMLISQRFFLASVS